MMLQLRKAEIRELLRASGILAVLASIFLTGCGGGGGGSSPAPSDPPPPPPVVAGNPTAVENQVQGTSQWQLVPPLATDAGSEIKGYASATSTNKGESITFYITVSPAQNYTIDVYRIGWYQGLGGRLMQHIGPLKGVTQPTCPTDATTGMIACNWIPAYTLQTQSSWTSGVYLAVLTNAKQYQNHIVFVVRDDTRVADLLYQQSVTTYQAYNNYPNDGETGKSLYSYNSYGAVTVTGGTNAAKVSFDRPYSGDGSGHFLRYEVNFVRWLEENGYDVTYSTDVDTSANGQQLLKYKAFLSVGHDEYWSGPMYDAVISARDAGVNVGFFGANAIYWQIRFEASQSGVPNRVVVCYKDGTIDPVTDPTLLTVRWRDSQLNRPEQTMIGVQQTGELLNDVPVAYVVTNSSNWVYAGTGLQDGDSIPGIVGYEADRLFGTYPAPNSTAGSYVPLSHSTFTDVSGAMDYSNSSIYQAPSGAWVFGSGSMEWSWGLDTYGHHTAVDARIQKTTTNIINRFVGHSN